MKNVPIRALLMCGCLAAVVACVPRREPPPPPAPQARPQPAAPVQTPPPPPARADWRDLPLSAGTWTYRSDGQGQVAAFGQTGSEPSFALRCDQATRRLLLVRSGTTSGNMMTVRTSYSARNLPLSIAGQPPQPFAAVAANDRLLDAMVFSRGRFTVEVPGTPMLVIPAWPEPARVVEDCRS